MEVKGLYRYGAWAIDPRNRPGHGGYWSSCASAFGRLLGLNLTETCIDEGSS
jgi:hypothetical protein